MYIIYPKSEELYVFLKILYEMWIKWFPVQFLEYSFVKVFLITMEYTNRLGEKHSAIFLNPI